MADVLLTTIGVEAAALAPTPVLLAQALSVAQLAVEPGKHVLGVAVRGARVRHERTVCNVRAALARAATQPTSCDQPPDYKQLRPKRAHARWRPSPRAGAR